MVSGYYSEQCRKQNTFTLAKSSIGQQGGFQQQDGTIIQGFPNQLGQKISVGRTPGDVIQNCAGEGWEREGWERKQASDPPHWSVFFPHNHNPSCKGRRVPLQKGQRPQPTLQPPHHAAKQQAHHLGVTFSESQLSWVQWGGGAQGPVGRDEKWAGLSLYPLPFPWRCGGACQRPDPLPTTCLEPARRLMSQLLSATPVPPLLPTGPATSDLRGADSLQDGG